MLGSLTPAEIDDLLGSEVVARIGCYAGGRVYVVPVAYAYDDGDVIGQSADGRKVRMMRENPNVCVEVDRVDDIANWRSVIAWGRYEELTGQAAVAALEILAARLDAVVRRDALPVAADAGEAESVLQELVVYRIHLGEKTGRFERRTPSIR